MIRTIPLKIQNEYITGDKGMIGAAGSHNDVILRMEFSGMWDGLTKMVQFRDALGETTIEVLLTADMLEADDTSVYLVPVPSGAKKYAGEMTLCIKGAAVSAQKETRATLAVYGRFTVAESKWSADAETEADVPASNVEQLQGQIDNVLATIVDARKAATEAAKSAEGAALSQSRAQTSEQYAGEYARDAANSATSAANSATSASDNATAAANSATAAKGNEDAAAGSAANAAASATSAGESASMASGKAANAANSASAAYSYAEDALTAASAARDSKRSAASSQNAAKLSENNAAASATAAEESIKHAPRINADGKWELWDATTNAYVGTEYTAIGEDGTKWWTYNGVFASLGEKIWVSYHDIPNASIGDFVLHTRNDAGVVYEITGRDALNYGEWLVKKRCVLKGTDGTTPHIGDNGNWYLGTTDTGEPSKGKSAYASAQDGGYTGTEAQFNTDLAAVGGKQAKITASGILKGDGAGGVSAAVKGTDYAGPSVGVSVTLSSSGWDADAKTQTVSVAGVTATANGSLRIAQSATDEQFTAWGAAQPRVTAQAAGTLTVKAAGTVPTIDIPVEVLIV